MATHARLSTSLFVLALLIVSLGTIGASAQVASAYSTQRQQVIHFIDTHVDSACHVADTATAAAVPDSNYDWARASARIRHSVRDFLKLRRQWLQLPFATGNPTRVELKFDSMLENIRIYIVSVARTVSGDWSYASFARGQRAYDRAVNDGVQVLLELDRLD
jgi:hypothetical protein